MCVPEKGEKIVITVADNFTDMRGRDSLAGLDQLWHTY
jgi:hypothetical protein